MDRADPGAGAVAQDHPAERAVHRTGGPAAVAAALRDGTLGGVPEDLVSTAEAAALLGVRRETVYVYVSRGLLTRISDTSRHQGSRFRRAEVLALRDRRRRPRAGVFEVAVETTISEVTPDGRLSYRGHSLADLLDGRGYESVAELLWQCGRLDWTPDAVSQQAAATARQFPAAPAANRVRLAVAALGCLDPVPGDPLAPAVLASVGPRALNAAVDAVDAVGVPTGAGSLAERLAAALGTPDVELVNAALICQADHELATSTIAARVAAGARSGPYEVVAAGLAAIAGPRHGAATMLARELLDLVLTDGIEAALERPGVGASWRDGLPGFGHIVYRAPDPRGVVLLDLIRDRDPELAELVDRLSLAVLRERSLWANADLALAAMEIALELAPGSTATIFGIARIAGFLAHATEESLYPLRFRPRASYVGPRP
ncbi:hypothetical protein CGZ96_17670 [Enemella evansiae]|nr:hypothetical protein CGZ96_17670 [Enemella evansiae]